MKILKLYNTRFEAEMTKNLLAEEGIESMIKADDMGGTQPALLIDKDVSLFVADDDYERASVLIDGLV